MDVSENAQIGAHKLGVSRHAHVRLHVLGGLAVLILHGEYEFQGNVGFQRAGALPNDAAAVGERRNRGIPAVAESGAPDQEESSPASGLPPICGRSTPPTSVHG